MSVISKDNPKHLYKVLDKNQTSPYQNFQFRKGKTYCCKEFDTDVTNSCSYGFYAVNMDGLPYVYNTDKTVFECEVWGNAVEIDQYKRRYKYFKLGRKLSIGELVLLAKSFDDSLGYRLSEVLNPINPFAIKPPKITDEHITLIGEWNSVGNSVWDSVRNSVRNSVWDSVWDSVGNSVWDSVWDSVRNSVGNSVWDSVRNSVWDSVWDSVGAYTGSLFTNIDKWNGIDHKKGEYPFQPAVNLWKQGLVPSYDGSVWRLHGGKNAEVLWSGKV